jgi:hypothetical protein
MACMVVRVQQAAECLNQFESIGAAQRYAKTKQTLRQWLELAWRLRDVDVTLDFKGWSSEGAFPQNLKGPLFLFFVRDFHHIYAAGMRP